MDDSELILQRMDALENGIREHLNMCQKLCLAKIEHVEVIANKAHTRLDNQKDSIQCLKNWKNQMTGRMWAVPFIIAPITAAITAVVIKVMTR